MALTPELVRAINAYLNTKDATTQRVLRFVESQWLTLDSWHDPDILSFAKRVAPVVEGGQANIGSLTQGYLSLVDSIVTGQGVSSKGIARDLMTSRSLRGVDGVELFQRTGLTIWSGLSQGKPLGPMVDKAGQRAVSMAKTNLQLASTHSARISMSGNQRIIGYNRVLAGETCALCELASDQLYHVEDLMPIHNNCTCSVSPVYGNSSPAERINAKSEDDNRADDVEVQEHGEIGPVLTVKGQAFTSADDI